MTATLIGGTGLTGSFLVRRRLVSGQSLKDAARKKPTYIVEFKEPLMRKIYEQIWDAASHAI